VIDLAALDALVATRVIERLDHQHLNEVLDRFAPGAAIPSSENLAGWIAAQVRDGLPAGVRLRKVRVEEDEDLAAEVTFP
jgi:6-pyruvoyl-tetrahydropterin synthase